MDKTHKIIADAFKQAKEERRKIFLESQQLSLGELIEKLSNITWEEKPPYIKFDFGSAIPTYFHSWRGAYRELAIGYELSGYDGDGGWDSVRIDSFLTRLKDSVGKTFEGWKGGDFKMNEDTPVWVSNEGNASNTAVVDVLDLEYKIVLVTNYQEY